jgi:hypothetical protein
VSRMTVMAAYDMLQPLLGLFRCITGLSNGWRVESEYHVHRSVGGHNAACRSTLPGA